MKKTGLTKLEAEALGYKVALLGTAIDGLAANSSEQQAFVGIGELVHHIQQTLNVASGR